ncbi:alpha/beta fold hydrolase [Streptomyces sp. NPDC090306]|uniref:alpha/beta fold hydrolase n=1 Tax=Streptomyces sp. NPDC090306 TaxID=3365961 RepID=UPI003800C280
MTAAVLVHGLYHQPEHFAAVAERLRVRGVDVAVPELHRGSLRADTAAVQAAVDELPEPPVLLGHSYGGSVITGVGGARHLVYLAAFVPDVGESAAALGGASRELRAAIVPVAGGSTVLHTGRAADVLYGDCPDPAASRAVGLLREQGAGCGRGVPERQSWKGAASTYVVCAQDRAVDPALQRELAARCTGVREWRTGHSPFVGHPRLVADLVLELLGADVRGGPCPGEGDVPPPVRPDGRGGRATRP